MKLYELTLALCQMLELGFPNLIERARASWNPSFESLDGIVVEQIRDQIRIALPTFHDDLKRAAYNEIADSEGLGRIEPTQVNFDFWITDSLLESVIEMLMESEGKDGTKHFVH